ncbi:unnamed protein product [Penicillium olsonii]|nr:unnamed protein product [Penicillium olsonii]CAG7916783.1 unnamed protein product [Penicillium olsonii]
MSSTSIVFGDGNLGVQVGINKGSIYLPDRPETPVDPLSTIPFRRDRDFVDREILFDQLESKTSVQGSRIALVGLGGVGKSQVAIEYCYRLRDRSPDTWVIWIYASNATRFEQSCRDVADQVRIPGRKIPKVNIFKLLRDWLNGKRNWVLVFDNVDDTQFLVETYSAGHEDTPDMRLGSDIQTRTIWSYFPESLTGSIVITSRNRGGISKLVEDCDIISVDPMDQEVGCLLFEKKLGMKADKEEILRLITALESMPLAIAQAAAYIRQRAPRYSVKKYLEDFLKSDRKRNTLLKYDEGIYRRDEEAENAILLTWQITFDHLRQERPSAANLLSLMSFFDRQRIPDHLLKGHTTEESDDWSLNAGSGAYSVSNSRSDNSSDLSESMFERLQRMASDDNTNETLDTYLHSPPLEPNDDEWEPNSPASRSQEHLDDFLGGRKEPEEDPWGLNSDGDSEATSDPSDYDSDIQSFSNDFEDDILVLRNYSLIAIGAVETHLAMHRLVQLATQEWLQDHSKLDEWKTSFIKVLYLHFPQPKFENRDECGAIFPHIQSATLQKSPAGDAPEEWATVLYRSASYLYENRNFLDASRMAELSTKVRQSVLGPTHHQTVESVEMLALSYLYCDLFEKGEKLLLKVLASRKQDLGEEHPSTLASMGNLGDAYRFQGRWDEAEKLQLQVLNAHKRMFGDEHPDTLTTMGMLADTLISGRRLKQAEDLTAQTLEIQKKVKGPEHPETMKTIDALALIYVEQKRFKEAEELRLQETEVFCRLLGAESESAVSSMVGLGDVFRLQKRYEEARTVFTQILETRRKTIGENHPETLSSIFNLAWTFFGEGKWSEAEALFAQVLQAQEKLFSQDHPSVLSTLSYLANVYARQDRWGKSEKIHTNILKRREKAYGLQHPFTLKSVISIGDLYARQSRCKEAEEAYRRALSGYEKFYGMEDNLTLGLVVSIGNICIQQDRLEETEELYTRALCGYEKIFGMEHELTLDVTAALGFVYKRQENWSQAEEFFKRALPAQENVLGVEHTETLKTKTELATIYKQQGQWAQAEDLWKQLLQSQEESLGIEDPTTLQTMAELGYVYEQQKKAVLAEELCERILKSDKKFGESDIPLSVHYLVPLAEMFEAQKQWNQSANINTRVFEICRNALGENHNQTLRALWWLASAYWNLERKDEAKACYVQVVETRRREYGLEDPETRASMRHLVIVFKKLCEDEAASAMEAELGSTH